MIHFEDFCLLEKELKNGKESSDVTLFFHLFSRRFDEKVRFFFKISHVNNDSSSVICSVNSRSESHVLISVHGVLDVDKKKIIEQQLVVLFGLIDKQKKMYHTIKNGFLFGGGSFGLVVLMKMMASQSEKNAESEKKEDEEKFCLSWLRGLEKSSASSFERFKVLKNFCQKNESFNHNLLEKSEISDFNTECRAVIFVVKEEINAPRGSNRESFEVCVVRALQVLSNYFKSTTIKLFFENKLDLTKSCYPGLALIGATFCEIFEQNKATFEQNKATIGGNNIPELILKDRHLMQKELKDIFEFINKNKN